MLKRRPGYISNFMIMILLVTMVFGGFAMNSLKKATNSINDNTLKSQSKTVDYSLSMYFSFSGNEYPADLEVLKKIGYLPTSFVTSKFTYSVKDDKSAYKLVTDLPSGGQYVSPGSNY